MTGCGNNFPRVTHQTATNCFVFRYRSKHLFVIVAKGFWQTENICRFSVHTDVYQSTLTKINRQYTL